MVSGFRREVDENCALLGYYTVSSGNLPMSVRNYHYSLPNSPEVCSSQDRQCTFNVTLTGVREYIVAVEKQYVSHIPSLSL